VNAQGAPGAGAGAAGAGASSTSAVPQESKDSVCKGIELTGGACDSSTASTTVETLVSNVISIFSWVVGIASVIMIMVGGFKYIVSQGDGGNVSSAKNTILYAIIGLVVALFAQLIVRFVINRV
jgi:hypothetical protein